MNEQNYFIYNNYKINSNPSHHDDRSYSDEAQDEVYEFAKNFLDENNYNTVIDIGCGSGYKLIKYFEKNWTIGIETEPCLSFLKSNYPNREWINSGKPEESFPNFNKKCDIVICADVIEHILNPDNLIEYINSFDYNYLIISTPDREILRSRFMNYGEKSWHGPPINPAHVREWDFKEFESYLNATFEKVTGFHCSRQIECMYFLCKPNRN
jgi:SAM-dependent methyltransferase